MHGTANPLMDRKVTVILAMVAVTHSSRMCCGVAVVVAVVVVQLVLLKMLEL